MRQLAVVGLVLSLLLGGIAVFEVSESVHTARNAQDRSLQEAVSGEISLISGGERQTNTALALMLVNPDVRQLLSASSPQGGRTLTPGARRSDTANVALTLATIKGASFLPLSAACLDDEQGRQLVCAPGAHPTVFPASLGRQFAALADSAPVGIASGAFVSPVNGQLSVAFLAPFRLHGRALGTVHLDISITATRQWSLLIKSAPDVSLQLGSYQKGRIWLAGPSSGFSPGTPPAARTLYVGTGMLSSHTRSLLNHGHRAMVAALPLTIGRSRQQIAVAATDVHADPSMLDAWTPGLLALLATAFVTLLGSTVGLAVSNRRVVRELSTDALTHLRNRRALIEELPRVCQRASEDDPAYLWFFDLNGFKGYNDSFGHLAGDTLLARLGARLRDVVRPYGSVYRLGGDEFCALVTARVDDPHALFLRARDALTEEGGAFTVSASAGGVEIPREARDPTSALRLADQHMYREKATSRDGAAELITAVLHAALAERHPDLGEHCDDVASDVELLARTIGLDEQTVGLIVKAGDLHDVGKLGIPDEIITNPGALSPQEWEFMRQHTVMGEKIIAAAGPSLDRIGPLVRASHERWDGKGYPDGLAGEQIPLGARIITICDSFRAMLDERAYKQAMSLEDALSELRRCSGTQFDPQLVEIFCRLVEQRMRAAERSTV